MVKGPGSTSIDEAGPGLYTQNPRTSVPSFVEPMEHDGTMHQANVVGGFPAGLQLGLISNLEPSAMSWRAGA